jgi:hypothetical protein
MSDSADPVTAPSSTNTWIRGLKWGTTWDSAGAVTTIYYAIADNATVDFGGDDVYAFQPYAEEMAAIADILQNVANIINVMPTLFLQASAMRMRTETLAWPSHRVNITIRQSVIGRASLS